MTKDGKIEGFIERLLQKDLDRSSYNFLFMSLSTIFTLTFCIALYFFIDFKYLKDLMDQWGLDPEKVKAYLIGAGAALWIVANALHKKIDHECRKL